ncbi:MAG: radical SAM family heme chaperone HemW [Bacteroidia bacterium]|nr:radical SAM family heme chaperone HemW [Bacteroidia bacterium]
MKLQMPGLYLHIPFCTKACLYCDFHFSTLLATKTEMVNAICKEIELRKDYLGENKINTIYFGGGTPSLLNEKELNLIFETINKHFTVEENAEITLEANPDDLKKANLQILKSVGINRLSIGLQSFLEDELKWMNRTHTAKESVECVKIAQQAGFNNISVDLIYGSKFQTLQTWQAALKQIEELNVQHLSCYNLTVEEKTALGKLVELKKENEVDDDLSAQQFLYLSEWAKTSGFDHYEISNLGKENYFSRHNTSYWEGEYYLGLGPSAHSYNGNSRQWNVSNNTVYMKSISEEKSFSEKEMLDERKKFNEYVLTRLRTKWGIDPQYMSTHFKRQINIHFEKRAEIEMANRNLLRVKGNLVLSPQAKLFADRIAQNFFL